MAVGWLCLNHGEVAQILNHLCEMGELPRRLNHKEPACQCRRHRRCLFSPRVRKIPWRRAEQPTPVFLPGESHGQRSLVGYSPRGRKELDMMEVTCTHAHMECVAGVFPVLCMCAKTLQLCPTLCNPMDCSPPGSSVHGILHIRILEWVAMPSSRGSS